MPQGQFTKTKHKLWKLKEKKIKEKKKSPMNQEILNPQHNQLLG